MGCFLSNVISRAYLSDTFLVQNYLSELIFIITIRHLHINYALWVRKLKLGAPLKVHQKIILVLDFLSLWKHNEITFNYILDLLKNYSF